MKATPTRQSFSTSPKDNFSSSVKKQSALPRPLKMEPVKEKKKDSFLMTLFKGYIAAHFLGFGAFMLLVPCHTMGATTRGRAKMNLSYLTSETSDSKTLANYGFEATDDNELGPKKDKENHENDENKKNSNDKLN